MAPPSSATTTKKPSNLAVRIISALVLIPIVLAVGYLGHPWFDLFVILFAGVMAWEWARIAGRKRDPLDPSPAARIAVSDTAPASLLVIGVVVAALVLDRFPEAIPALLPSWALILVGTSVTILATWPAHGRRSLWFGLGVLYVATPAMAMLWVRDDPATGQGVMTLVWILALVIATDTGAYAAGRSIGGPKLAPRISPNKTWAGLLGGMASAALVGLVFGLLLHLPSVWKLMILSSGLAVIEQVGDLLESAFKRRFGMKDSSHIIPGHGGVLDRVDGLLAVSVAVAALDYFGEGSVLSWL
nr:phosphatidate cytidylyltransferase [uncultured Dongia sp.]